MNASARVMTTAMVFLGFASVGLATTLCIKPTWSCAQTGGWCQGTQVRCETGWSTVSANGQTCTTAAKRKANCETWTGCAPGASNTPPGNGSQNLECDRGGQSCYCTTHDFANDTTSTNEYYFYSNCTACTYVP